MMTSLSHSGQQNAKKGLFVCVGLSFFIGLSASLPLFFGFDVKETNCKEHQQTRHCYTGYHIWMKVRELLFKLFSLAKSVNQLL